MPKHKIFCHFSFTKRSKNFTEFTNCLGTMLDLSQKTKKNSPCKICTASIFRSERLNCVPERNLSYKTALIASVSARKAAIQFPSGICAAAFKESGANSPFKYFISPSAAIIAALSVQYFFSGRTSLSPLFRHSA